jgi:hypothetical protein
MATACKIGNDPLPRPPPYAQDLADRRRHPRDRPGPAARPPPARRTRHLQPRHPRHAAAHHWTPSSTAGRPPSPHPPPPCGACTPHNHTAPSGRCQDSVAPPPRGRARVRAAATCARPGGRGRTASCAGNVSGFARPARRPRQSPDRHQCTSSPARTGRHDGPSPWSGSPGSSRQSRRPGVRARCLSR